MINTDTTSTDRIYLPLAEVEFESGPGDQSFLVNWITRMRALRDKIPFRCETSELLACVTAALDSKACRDFLDSSPH